MTKIRKTIPSKISVGGQTIKVEFVDKLEGSFQLGECSATGSYIKIANNTENVTVPISWYFPRRYPGILS